MKIGIANDHAGFQLKEEIKNYFESNGFEVVDFGTNSTDSVDYPDYVHPAVNSFLDGDTNMTILVCGTGNGVCMTANKWNGIRAALCWNSNIAKLARQHNDANCLCLPARSLNREETLLIVKSFFETEFEGGRHLNRINKINPNF